MRLNRLSPLNQMYRYMSYLVNANSCEWIVLDGALDMDILRIAARKVVELHPVLNSIQVRMGFGYYWKELGHPVTVVIRHEKLDQYSDTEIHARLVGNIWNEPLPLTRSPPWRIHVSETGDGTTWLQIVTTHVFTDGRSANLVARDLAAAYGAALAGTNLPTPNPLKVRDPFSLFAHRLTAGERWHMRGKAILAIFRDAVVKCVGLKSRRGPRGRTGARFFDFGPSLWNELHGRARSVGLSVHPIILAAVLRTVQRINKQNGVDGEIIRVIDNFSLRRFADHPDEIADVYDVYAIPYTMDVSVRSETREMVNNIREQLNALKSGGILMELFRQQIYMWSSVLSPKKLATKMVTKLVTRSNVICTNIGPVPEEFSAFGMAKVRDYYSFSQLFPPGEMMFLFSTFRGRLRMVLLYDEARFDAGLITRIGEELFPGCLLEVLDECAPVAGRSTNVA